MTRETCQTMLVGLCLLWFLIPDGRAQEEPVGDLELTFQNANKAMVLENYADAVAGYEACLAQQQSANLHHNYAVANYLTGETGLAVLHLEKAIRMGLTATSSREVLSLIRRTEGLSPPRYRLLQQLARSLPESFWLVLTVVSFWGVLVFGIYLHLLVKRAQVYRDLAVVSGFLFLLAIAACAGLQDDSRLGVLIGEENGLKVIPTAEGEAFMVLTGGEMARKLSENNQFVFIETQSSARGWVSADQFQLIR